MAEEVKYDSDNGEKPAAMSSETSSPTAAPSDVPKAVQIIETSPAGDSFTLHEERLQQVLNRAPPRMKVSVLSVVGAFRTGKSFLLDLVLKFLDTADQQKMHRPDPAVWMDPDSKIVGAANVGGDQVKKGFSWRAGRERETTGIWMWSHPYIRELPGGTGEKVAVFVVDTQGMFDSSTSQMLTACIFGISTLISSYQIYNVTERVKEDNLQHLALFSEYGRIGSRRHRAFVRESSTRLDLSGGSGKKAGDSGDEGTEGGGGAGAGAGAGAGVGLSGDADTDSDPIERAPTDSKDDAPFQVLEFLVRDAKIRITPDDMPSMLKEMESYLAEVLEQTHLEDLRHTREQITSCFKKICCFELPHPGFDVAEEDDYDGSISKIRDKFRFMVTHYISSLFTEKLVAKRVHGNFVTAPELSRFIVAYCQLFSEATVFPAAKDLLSATADANNANARASSLLSYKTEMDTIAGTGRPHVKDDALDNHHNLCFDAAMEAFRNTANFGSRSAIETTAAGLQADMQAAFDVYKDRNSARNPFKDAEYYVVPLVILFAAYFVRLFTDVTLGDDSGPSVAISQLISAIFFFFLLLAATRGRQLWQRLQPLVNLAINAAGGGGGKPKQD